MSGMHAKITRIGIALCTLTIAMFGCPQPGADGDGGSNSGLPLAGNPGNSNSSGGGNRNTVLLPSSPTLFVADPNEGTMSFPRANSIDGNVAPTTFIDSFERFRRTDDQFIVTPVAVCVDRVGTLIVGSGAPSLRFYNNAATVTGIPDANRQIGGLASRLSDIDAIAYDRANDRLFVGTSDRVLIFEGSVLTKNGEVAPTRVFSSVDLPGRDLPADGSMALGPNGDLYVPDLSGDIQVFANAGLRSGEIRADRKIHLSLFFAEFVWVDSSDHLYAGDVDEIAVLQGASALTGDFETFPTMKLEGVKAINESNAVTTEIAAITVDSRGIGYVADIANAAIHIIENIAARTGDVRAERAITGPGVVFTSPRAIFLWE